ncbi:unnamed protein product, partial [Symbiodinium pilosum]
ISPAQQCRVAACGTIIGTESVEEYDADFTRRPRAWTIALDSNNQQQRRLHVEALWDNNKLRWVCHTVLTPTGDSKQRTRLTIDAWYQLCQKEDKRDKVKGL